MRQSVALGDSIFHGTVAGGTCFTCHGAHAKGTALAPDLTDTLWLNGDGSFPFIMRTVMHGVPRPTRYPAPMPPMGGARLTMPQARAVADYVYRLSHPAR
jgi:mono/diheme cytochrome c family protein